jgi:hypothetical protein
MLQVTYRGVEKTPTLDGLIRSRVRGLERYYNRLGGCRVALEKPHRQREAGSGWRVRIDMMVPPRHELVIIEDANKGEEPSHVVQVAFAAAERLLKKAVDRIRGEEKVHPWTEEPPQASER